MPINVATQQCPIACAVKTNIPIWEPMVGHNSLKVQPVHLYSNLIYHYNCLMGQPPSQQVRKQNFTFATSEKHTEEFFITRLDQGYSVVLGYDWLAWHNPIINWVETKVVFPEARTSPETSQDTPDQAGHQLSIWIIEAGTNWGSLIVGFFLNCCYGQCVTQKPFILLINQYKTTMVGGLQTDGMCMCMYLFGPN